MSGRRVVGDVSKLPPYGFGSHSAWYWATVGFMMIEGAGFALALGAYVFLMGGAQHWPIRSPPPALWAGTLQVVVLVVSVWPTLILAKAAKAQDLGATRRWAVIVSLFNAAALVVRAFEFPVLHTRWDLNAYGSITWALMILHTTHIVTDFLDSGVLTVLMFTGPIEEHRFVDVEENAVYWYFVVLAWLPIYGVIYWAPRLI